MQYEEFEHDILFKIIPNKEAFIRNGQAIMIYLNDVSKVLYDKVTGTEFDCFYVDGNIPKTLKYLKDNWHLNFRPINVFVEDFCIDQTNKFKFLAFRYEIVEKTIYVGVINRDPNNYLPDEYTDSEFNMWQMVLTDYPEYEILFGDDDDDFLSHKFTENSKIIDCLTNI